MSSSSKTNIIANQLNAIADEQLTVSNAAAGKVLTPTKYFDGTNNVIAKRAIITIENAQLRYRTTGSAPTTIRLVSVTRDWGHMIFFWEES